MVKKFLDILVSSKLLIELDNLVNYLNFVSLRCKNNDLSFRIRKIINLIQQIKLACGQLYKELRLLRAEMKYLNDSAKFGRKK